MQLSECCARLDERLRTDEYADVDASANGLQVGPDDHEVRRVAFAVDAVAATIEAAAEWDADLLVTHHGISWDGIERVTGREYGRIAPLVDGDLALYVSHLPLDGHPDLGNAAGVADLLDLTDREAFGAIGGEHIGQRGRLPEPTGRDRLRSQLAKRLATGPGEVRLLSFGPERIEDVAVVTGAGADWLDEAVAAGADALVTGEGKGRLYHQARESVINVVLGGHYATETFGVGNLRELLDDWGLETRFIERPTGL